MNIHQQTLERTITDFVSMAEERLKSAGFDWEKLEEQYPATFPLELPGIVNEARIFLCSLQQLKAAIKSTDVCNAANQAISFTLALQYFCRDHFDEYARKRINTSANTVKSTHRENVYREAMKLADVYAQKKPNSIPSEIADAVMKEYLNREKSDRPSRRELVKRIANKYPTRPRK